LMQLCMSKLAGILAESIFITECLSRDIPIYKPIADMYGIDFIAGNTLKKIQVKSTFVSDDRYPNKPTYKVKFTCGANSRGYSGDEFDYAAVYIALADTWYLIPVEHLSTKTIRVNPYKETCKWNAFKADFEALM